MIKNTKPLYTFLKSKDLLRVTNFFKFEKLQKFKKLPIIIKKNNTNKVLSKVINNKYN